MAEGLLAVLTGFGLAFSIAGSWILLRSTPILGEGEDGYATQSGGGKLVDLERRQRNAWRLLVVGFALQFIGSMGVATVAFCRHFGYA